MMRNRPQTDLAVDEIEDDDDDEGAGGASTAQCLYFAKIIRVSAPRELLFDEHGKKLGTKKARSLAAKEEKKRQNEVS